MTASTVRRIRSFAEIRDDVARILGDIVGRRSDHLT
jgi:hypothetical protein